METDSDFNHHRDRCCEVAQVLASVWSTMDGTELGLFVSSTNRALWLIDWLIDLSIYLSVWSVRLFVYLSIMIMFTLHLSICCLWAGSEPWRSAIGYWCAGARETTTAVATDTAPSNRCTANTRNALESKQDDLAGSRAVTWVWNTLCMRWPGTSLRPWHV